MVSPLRLCWVKGVCVFRCNLLPAFLAELQGSFMCYRMKIRHMIFNVQSTVRVILRCEQNLIKPHKVSLLCISYKDYVTNEEVRAKIQQAIGPHEDRLIIVKRHKLKWYGHVSRSLGLAKTILQGTVNGERRQGRQRRR